MITCCTSTAEKAKKNKGECVHTSLVSNCCTLLCALGNVVCNAVLSPSRFALRIMFEHNCSVESWEHMLA